MVKLEPKIELGKLVLELLDKKNINPNVFIWFYLTNSNSWRLVISADTYNNKDIKDYYKSFIEQFGNENIIKEIGLSNITIVPDTDNLINILKMEIRTDKKSISDIRFKSNVINGVLIDDAYIYRLFYFNFKKKILKYLTNIFFKFII